MDKMKTSGVVGDMSSNNVAMPTGGLSTNVFPKFRATNTLDAGTTLNKTIHSMEQKHYSFMKEKKTDSKKSPRLIWN